MLDALLHAVSIALVVFTAVPLFRRNRWWLRLQVAGISAIGGPAFGSDHFPIVVALELDAGARHEQQPPARRAEDEREAQEKERRAATETGPRS